MAQNNKKISPIIKSSVLLELTTEGYSVTKIAQAYGISKPVIYSWIREIQAAKMGKVSDVNLPSRTNFVEVELIEGRNYGSVASVELK